MYKPQRAKRVEVKALRSWLEQYANKLPFKCPWYLTAADAEDVMGQVWLNIIGFGLLDKKVSLGYLIIAVRNEMRRRGLIQRARSAANEAFSASVRMQEEHAHSDFMDALQRRLSLAIAARHLEERHHRALELLFEGYTSAEVADILCRKHGWYVTAGTIRQWHRRYINPFFMAKAS
jgi:hypothetical protein